MKPTKVLLASFSTSTSTVRTRPLPLKKSHLFQSHLDLLTSSPTILFLRPDGFTSKEWRQLRSSLPSPSTSTSPSPPAKSRLTHLRPGLLPALLRSPQLLSILPPTAITHLSSSTHLKGPLCALTLPSLDPPTLNKLLKALQKVSETPKENAAIPPSSLEKKGKAAEEEKPNRLELLSSLLELSRSFDRAGTENVGTLPDLDGLRGQLVGLLSMGGRGIVRVLGQRGREVAGVVEGFKEGLREGEGGVSV